MAKNALKIAHNNDYTHTIDEGLKIIHEIIKNSRCTCPLCQEPTHEYEMVYTQKGAMCRKCFDEGETK